MDEFGWPPPRIARFTVRQLIVLHASVARRRESERYRRAEMACIIIAPHVEKPPSPRDLMKKGANRIDPAAFHAEERRGMTRRLEKWLRRSDEEIEDYMPTRKGRTKMVFTSVAREWLAEEMEKARLGKSDRLRRHKIEVILGALEKVA